MPGLFDDLIPNPAVDRVSRGILGEEKGTPRSVSPQGARGVGQIEPGTFKQYALPGENIDNDKDNRAVHRRMIYDFVVHKKMDPGQAATAYFSGEGNVARGGATPWKQNRGDVNESTSSYVAHAERGMKPARRLFDDLIPKTAAPPKKGLFDDLIPKQEPWRVPKANEGQVVHAKRGELPQGPQRDPGAVDPEIEARLAPQIAANNKNHPLWAQVAKGMVHGAEVVHAMQRMGSDLASDYYDKFKVFGDVASGKTSLNDPATQRRVEEAGVLFGGMEVPGGESSLVGAGRAPRTIEEGAPKEIPVDKSASPTAEAGAPKKPSPYPFAERGDLVAAGAKPLTDTTITIKGVPERVALWKMPDGTIVREGKSDAPPMPDSRAAEVGPKATAEAGAPKKPSPYPFAERGDLVAAGAKPLTDTTITIKGVPQRVALWKMPDGTVVREGKSDAPPMPDSRAAEVGPKAVEDALKGGRPKYTIIERPRTPEDEGYEGKTWNVHDENGKHIAEITGTITDKNFHIDFIGLPGEETALRGKNVEAGALGVTRVRSIADAIKQKFPEVKTVSGERFSGSHGLNSGENKVPTVTQSLGAAATPPVVQEAWAKVPPAPTNEFIQSQDDGFYRLRQSATADREQATEVIQALPKELKDSQVQKKIFESYEPGQKPILTPQEQALKDKYAEPLHQENADLWREAQKMNGASKDGIVEFDPDYIHRMPKGKSPEFDPWMGEASEANPVAGYKSTKASSQRERKYFAIESASGQRKVVAMTDHGPMIMEKGQPSQPLPRYEGAASQPGDKFKLNGQEWTVGQAKASEITGAGGPEYYQNAMASLITNNLQLKAVVRAQYELERLKGTPEFAAYSVMDNQYHSNPNLYKGWRTVDIPIYRGRRFEPRFADVIDDFWKGNQPMLPKLAAINRFAVMSMFWTPVGHAANAGAHWFSERGWDNVTGWRSLAVDGAKAIKAVVTQNKDYQKFLREGGGLVYGSVANTEFYGDMLKALGEDVKRHPAAWDPIARVFGVGPSDLVKMLYGASARTLWATSDVFMMQRYYELMRKGKSAREAIAEAEKHIPNYRIPPQVLGSRGAAQLLKNPNIFEFAKYHYKQLESIAHMAKDIANVKDPKLMWNTAGKIFATAFLMYFVTPIISSGLQKLLKDEDIEYGPKGSTAIPQAIIDAYQGKKSYTDIIQRLFSLSPILHMALETYTNRDMFTGKHILEPGDMQRGRLGRVGAQAGEFVAQNLVSPYSTISRGVEEREGRGSLVGDIAKQALGARKIPKVWHGGQGRERDVNAAEAAKRHARPRGLIEEGEKRLEEKYGGTQ